MDKEKELKCTEYRESLKKMIANFLKIDPKSAVRINISSAYGFQTVGYDAELFLEMLNKECKESRNDKR